MKLLGGLLKVRFALTAAAVIAVQCCAGTALLGRMPLAAGLLFAAAILLTAGAACYFPLKRRRPLPYALLFAGAALSCGLGAFLTAPPVSLHLTAFGWFHLSALTVPFLAAGGECFSKLPAWQKTGSRP